MDFKIEKLQLKRKEREIKIKKIFLISFIGFFGIAISIYSFLQSNIPLNIIIISLVITSIIFLVLLYFLCFKNKKTYIDCDQKIVFTDNAITHHINNKKIQISNSQIQSVRVILNRNKDISQIIIKGQQEILIKNTIENINIILNEIEKRIDPSIIKYRKLNYLNIFAGIGTALILILIYFLKFKFKDNVISLVLDKVIPLTGGVSILFFVKRKIIPGKVKIYILVALSLILFSIVSLFFEISTFNNKHVEVANGYIINFPKEPKITETDIENAKITSYSSQYKDSIYLVERYDLGQVLIIDTKLYFKDLAEKYAKTTNTNIVNFSSNEEMMSLTLVSEKQDAFIEIKRIILSEKVLINTLIYSKTENGLSTSESKNFSKSLVNKKNALIE